MKQWLNAQIVNPSVNGAMDQSSTILRAMRHGSEEPRENGLAD